MDTESDWSDPPQPKIAEWAIPISRLMPNEVVFERACEIFQWNEFSGVMTVNGIGYIPFTLNPAVVEDTQVYIIPIRYNGRNKKGRLELNSDHINNVKFYLNTAASSEAGREIEIGDTFTIFGSAVVFMP